MEGNPSIEDYYKEIEVLLMQLGVVEDREVMMMWILSKLNWDNSGHYRVASLC